jgi:hypothetical protein
MLNPNEQTLPTAAEMTIDPSKVITYLQRLGVTQEELSSESFNENTIASKVFANEVLAEEYNKTIKTNQDNFLTGKLKKIMSDLTGLTEDEVKEDTDFRKIIAKGFDKVKITGNQDVDNIAMDYRNKELQYQSQLEHLQTQLDAEKVKTQSELKDYKVTMRVDSFINTSNLTQAAKASQKEITEFALHTIRKEYDIREKDGLLVLWHKGGQPAYKANSSQPTLLEDALETHLDKMGFLKKQEEVKTLSNTQSPKNSNSTSIGWSRKGHFGR